MPRRNPWRLAAPVLLVAVSGFWAWAAYDDVQRRRETRSWVTTPARVVDDGGLAAVFEDRSGGRRVLPLDELESEGLDPGDTVDLTYDPATLDHYLAGSEPDPTGFAVLALAVGVLAVYAAGWAWRPAVAAPAPAPDVGPALPFGFERARTGLWRTTGGADEYHVSLERAGRRVWVRPVDRADAVALADAGEVVVEGAVRAGGYPLPRLGDRAVPITGPARGPAWRLWYALRRVDPGEVADHRTFRPRATLVAAVAGSAGLALLLPLWATDSRWATSRPGLAAAAAAGALAVAGTWRVETDRDGFTVWHGPFAARYAWSEVEAVREEGRRVLVRLAGGREVGLRAARGLGDHLARRAGR